MKKILVTGGGGQLASCIQKLSSSFEDRFEFRFANSKELNIVDANAVLDFFEDYRPDYCINTAAYTAVDLAETQMQEAFAVNAIGPGNLAEACNAQGAVLIQISTDYVFSGDTNLPYTEEDFTEPGGMYGRSKLCGEEVALEKNPKTIVLRTSWLYSEFNKNFVKTMLHLFSQRDTLGVVADQYGQPTNANDLAEAIMHIIETEPKTYGIYHFSNYPETTWFHFAQKIAEFSGSEIAINPLTTAEYPTPAKRPRRSTMCLDKIERDYQIEPKHWENSLRECIEILKG